jgi:hypothetical protein
MDPSQPAAIPTTIFAAFHRLFADYWERQGRLLGPCQVWLTLMCMTMSGTKGYGRSLDEMKRLLGQHFGWGDHRPTPSALTQARRKLTRAVCDEAMQQVRAGCLSASQFPRVRFGPWRLVACDGTSLNLPVYATLRRHFGVPRSSHGDCPAPQAALTLLFDVGAHQPIAFHLERCRYPERKALVGMLDHLHTGDLLIADRGYPSRALFAELHTRHLDFLIRATAANSNSIAEFQAFLRSGQTEAVVELRLLTPQQRLAGDGAHALCVRLIRFRADGVLVTSLTQHQASAEDLTTLYMDRWRIETAFSEMKGFRGLEAFHARTPIGIYQEVTAVMLFMLLESELEAQAHQHHATEIEPTNEVSTSGERQATTIRFNRLMIGDWVRYLLIDATIGPAKLQDSLQDALRSLWRARMRYKPRRSFPRETKSPYGKWRLRPRVSKDSTSLT